LATIALVTGAFSSNGPDTVCYGDLGCFTTAKPWTSDVRPISQLPEDPAIINTQFLLNTRSDPDVPLKLTCNDVTQLNTSPFNGNKKTVFLIHGWMHDANHSWIRSSVKEILINEDVNIFSVDWASGGGLPYLRALTNTQVVGAQITQFILFLLSATPLQLAQIHLIGHNLGAHAAGYSGHNLFGLGRITGLDPATLYFEGGDSATYLDKSDALFVDIIHTDQPYKKHIGLGFQSNIGHVDILVNNGQQQPGCEDKIKELVRSARKLVTLKKMKQPLDYYMCSHMRAVDYFVESINSACPFSAYACGSWDKFQEGTCYTPCRTDSCTSMGYHSANYGGRGVFHMDTQASSPFCNAAIRLQVEIDTVQKSTNGRINFILIGEVGQTKEAQLKGGLIGPGFILAKTISVPGSNALRLGKIGAVRLLFERDGFFQGKKVFVKQVLVDQANVTIDAVSYRFQGSLLNNGKYETVLPQES